MKKVEVMRVYDLESSIRNADFKSFQKYYNGEIHQEFTNDNLSMVELLFTESSNCGNRMQIAEHLIHQSKTKSTALHLLLGSAKANWFADPQYLLQEAELLIKNGADVNLKDSHGGTPLSYAIATLKASSEKLLPLYKVLLNAGAYVDERSGVPSCLELTKIFPWRADLLLLLEDFQRK
jgi:ankyrin repeat protein, putative